MSKKKIKIPESIFDMDTTGDLEEEWRGMPEFNQPDNSAYRQVIVSFEDEEGVAEFFKLINQTYTSKTKSVWFPDRETNRVADLFYYDESTLPADVGKQDGTA